MDNKKKMTFTPGAAGAGNTPPLGPPGNLGAPIGPQQGQQLQLNVDPAELACVVCEKCSGKIFEQKTVLKQVSAIQSPTGKEGILPVNIIVCSNCLHPVKDFVKLLEK